MYKVDLPLDQSKEKAVEARRAAEKARKARIFNTRFRTMGLDLDGLNQQLVEKQHKEEFERKREKLFELERRYQEQTLLKLDNNEKEKRKALNQDLCEYWAAQQRVQDSDDVHLQGDLKGAYNLTIPESKLGPASMYIFEGEGTGMEQMMKEQIKKTEKDLQNQIDENKRIHMGKKHRDMLVNKELLYHDLKARQQAELAEERKKAARLDLDSFNQALAAEQAEKLKAQRTREERENLNEMWHTMTSDMMTECPEAAKRPMGGGRPPHVLPDRWKGMSPEQLDAIQKERERQCFARQRKRDVEKVLDAAWDFQFLKVSQQVEEEDQKMRNTRKEHRTQMERFNMQLAREQQLHQEYLNKKLYTNQPNKDYFDQFNTTSR